MSTLLDKASAALLDLETTIADFQLFGVRIERAQRDGNLTAGLEQDLEDATWTLVVYQDTPLPILANHAEFLWQAFLASDDLGEWWVEPAGTCDGCSEHPLGHEWAPRRCISTTLTDGVIR